MNATSFKRKFQRIIKTFHNQNEILSEILCKEPVKYSYTKYQSTLLVFEIAISRGIPDSPGRIRQKKRGKVTFVKNLGKRQYRNI